MNMVLCQCVPMHSSYPSTRQHGGNGQRHRWHVDDHSVSFHDSLVFENIGHLTCHLQQLSGKEWQNTPKCHTARTSVCDHMYMYIVYSKEQRAREAYHEKYYQPIRDSFTGFIFTLPNDGSLFGKHLHMTVQAVH